MNLLDVAKSIIFGNGKQCDMVASKYFLNHFISEKYKTVQSVKLHFLQNSPLMRLYTSDSHCIGIGNIPGSHFVKAFSAPLSHS